MHVHKSSFLLPNRSSAKRSKVEGLSCEYQQESVICQKLNCTQDWSVWMFGLDKKTILKRNIVDILDMELQTSLFQRASAKNRGRFFSVDLRYMQRNPRDFFKCLSRRASKTFDRKKNGITLLRTNSSLQYFSSRYFLKICPIKLSRHLLFIVYFIPMISVSKWG